MTRLALLASVLAVAACSKTNPYYCEDNPDHNCTVDAGDNGGPQTCTASGQCTNASAPVCDTDEGTCVACTANEIGACAGTTPVCSANQTCVPCATHGQCTASNTCLPTGACGDASQVAYVSAGGSGTACTLAAPCPRLADALAKNLPFVKIAADGAANDTAAITIDGKAVTILAEPGAKLDRDGDGPILEVRSANADVAIYDLLITGATGASGVGLLLTPNGGTPKLSLTRATVASNQGGGISASGGALTVTRSTVSSNSGVGISASGGALTVTRSTVSSNQGGGISISGTGTMFTITNNVIVYNGMANGANATQLGGAAITSNTAGAKLEFNTIAFNQCDGSIYRAGATCTGGMVTAGGNLLYRNSESDGAGGLKTDDTTQRNASGCQFGNTFAVATDASNLGFKSPATLPFDFHLTTSSPSTVVDAGGTCTGMDVDGDMRPQGGACDLGADERMP